MARGIALIFFVAGLATIALALLAFATRAYRRLSASYAPDDGGSPAERSDAGPQAPAAASPAARDRSIGTPEGAAPAGSAPDSAGSEAMGG